MHFITCPSFSACESSLPYTKFIDWKVHNKYTDHALNFWFFNSINFLLIILELFEGIKRDICTPQIDTNSCSDFKYNNIVFKQICFLLFWMDSSCLFIWLRQTNFHGDSVIFELLNTLSSSVREYRRVSVYGTDRVRNTYEHRATHRWYHNIQSDILICFTIQNISTILANSHRVSNFVMKRSMEYPMCEYTHQAKVVIHPDRNTAAFKRHI